jgi:hypothetical protein
MKPPVTIPGLNRRASYTPQQARDALRAIEAARVAGIITAKEAAGLKGHIKRRSRATQTAPSSEL